MMRPRARALSEETGLRREALFAGVDRQNLRPNGVKKLNAAYEMLVHDGTALHLNNQVIVDTDAAPDRHAVLQIQIVALDGSWSRLNHRFFRGSLHSPRLTNGYVIVRRWEVLCKASVLSVRKDAGRGLDQSSDSIVAD